MNYPTEEGLLGGTLPYIAIGQGEPLIFVRTVTPESGNPTGASRWAELKALKAYAKLYKVYAVSRNPKAPVSTMSDIAAQYAEAIQREFKKPVRIMGISTGGSLALQIAADYPNQVKALAIVAASFRLSPEGKSLQATYAHYLQKHDIRNAEKALAPLITQTTIGRLAMGALLWLTAPLAGKPAYEQMVTFLHAEDTFNLQDRLATITPATLIIAGDKDKVYAIDDVRTMARTMPRATLSVHAGRDHRGVIADTSIPKEVQRFFGSLAASP